jgi:hypothetical protein
VIYRDSSGALVSGTIQSPKPYGSGILAIAPTSEWRAAGASGDPGDITVETPHGNIISTLGGIAQFALNGSTAGGPTVTLTAGSPGYNGNVDLGQGGVIGGTINITAQGSIKGLIVSRENSTINAGQSFSGTLLAGGVAPTSPPLPAPSPAPSSAFPGSPPPAAGASPHRFSARTCPSAAAPLNPLSAPPPPPPPPAAPLPSNPPPKPSSKSARRKPRKPRTTNSGKPCAPPSSAT